MKPLYLLFGLLAFGLLARAILRGSVSYRYGRVSRSGSPLVFWMVVAANAVIASGALAMGLGALGK